jgi:hypothetical protein
MPRLGGILALGALLPWFSGCESPSVSGPGPAAAPAMAAAKKSNPFDAITKGMTVAEVRALVGDPLATKPIRTGGMDGEIWSYQFKVGETVREVSLGTQELPLTNPRTGVTGTTQEPVYSHEFTVSYQDIKMLVIGGLLVEIVRQPRTERKID